jgi:hypothetical protein
MAPPSSNPSANSGKPTRTHPVHDDNPGTRIVIPQKIPNMDRKLTHPTHGYDKKPLDKRNSLEEVTPP